MTMSAPSLTSEEANLIDRITSKLKLPFAVKNETSVYDSEYDTIIAVCKCIDYIEEALDGNKETLSNDEMVGFEALREKFR